MFADFLIDVSGDPSIFGDIGAAFGRGETMDDWLGQQGAGHGLPATMSALESAWRAYLAARFGPPKGS